MACHPDTVPVAKKDCLMFSTHGEYKDILTVLHQDGKAAAYLKTTDLSPTITFPQGREQSELNRIQYLSPVYLK